MVLQEPHTTATPWRKDENAFVMVENEPLHAEARSSTSTAADRTSRENKSSSENKRSRRGSHGHGNAGDGGSLTATRDFAYDEPENGANGSEKPPFFQHGFQRLSQTGRDFSSYRRDRWHRDGRNWFLRHLAPDGFNLRHELVAFIGEFLGTTMFIMLSLGGTNVALQGSNSIDQRIQENGASEFDSSNLAYIALSFGAALAVSVWCFFRVSGGLFNPAVTWAFMLIGAVTPLRGIVLFVTQLCGGMSGAALARTLTLGSLHAQTTLHKGINHARGLFIEFFMTAILVFAILMMAVEKSRSTPIAPLGIGLTLFICEIFSVYWTGGSLNPARSLGPAVVDHHFPGYHWIYWVGPLSGSILAVCIYWILKALRYIDVGGAIDDLSFPDPDSAGALNRNRETTQVLPL